MISGANPLTALACEWNPGGSWYAHGASAVVVFEMTKGIVFSYRGSWCAEGLNTPWEAQWRIIGEKGTVLWDGADGFRAECVTGSVGFIRDKRTVEMPYDNNAMELSLHAECIDEFIRCVKDGKTPQTAYTDNIRSLSMVHAAIESAASDPFVGVQA